jgi:hypothetical protein
MTTKTPQKKEGRPTASSGKKARPEAILSSPDHIPDRGAVIDSAPPVPSNEKKNPVIGLGITYSEVGAAEKLGIGAEDVSWLRQGVLDLGKDYTREAGFVRITAVGLSKLETLLAQGSTLLVVAANLPNPNLVLARRPGGKDILRVRVADSAAWVKGMIMPGCISTSVANKFICEARPRFKGRI